MSKFGNVVQEFYVERFHANMAERAGRLRGVTEPGQARAYIDDARRRVRKSFQLPEHSGEPAARITGRLRGNGFTVEKLLYESRPGLLVSANYYLPEKISGRHPAVLFLCGHSGTGKAGDTYQMAAQALALCGFAVLIPDPVGQGERGQFHGIPGAEALSRNCTHEHNMYGKQLLLTGEFFGTWRVFDAVRALDWLLARPEVDATRVGVTGNSGGGTLTTYVNALDDRITMAAPCCYITRWWRHVENELPVDAEQTPPGLAAAGGEMADMLFAAAPRPLLICGQRDDFFDPRGTLECYDELRRVYRILGCETRWKASSVRSDMDFLRIFVSVWSTSSAAMPGRRRGIFPPWRRFRRRSCGAPPREMFAISRKIGGSSCSFASGRRNRSATGRRFPLRNWRRSSVPA
ncbi:MAG: acetylxylan esterase [Lentisphaeria bacterium]|nr:MAG: acetylxylan esterase [Lentisphaeria bacterium]